MQPEELPLGRLYIRFLSLDLRRDFHPAILMAAFNEGARLRAADDPLRGFPVWDVADLYLMGA